MSSMQDGAFQNKSGPTNRKAEPDIPPIHHHRYLVSLPHLLVGLSAIFFVAAFFLGRTRETVKEVVIERPVEKIVERVIEFERPVGRQDQLLFDVPHETVEEVMTELKITFKKRQMRVGQVDVFNWRVLLGLSSVECSLVNPQESGFLLIHTNAFRDDQQKQLVLSPVFLNEVNQKSNHGCVYSVRNACIVRSTLNYKGGTTRRIIAEFFRRFESSVNQFDATNKNE